MPFETVFSRPPVFSIDVALGYDGFEETDEFSKHHVLNSRLVKAAFFLLAGFFVVPKYLRCY